MARPFVDFASKLLALNRKVERDWVTLARRLRAGGRTNPGRSQQRSRPIGQAPILVITQETYARYGEISWFR